jgi:hypothetical protein
MRIGIEQITNFDFRSCFLMMYGKNKNAPLESDALILVS